MPSYKYSLSNGKSLVFEGDTQPSDTEVESAARARGVSLVRADDRPQAPIETIIQRMLDAGEPEDAIASVIQEYDRTVASAVPAAPFRDLRSEIVTGALKGVGDTAVGLGRLVHKIPGVSRGVDALYSAMGVEGVDSAKDFGGAGDQDAESRLGLDATNTPQQIGKVLEKGAEFMIPAGATRAAVAKVAPAAVGRLLPAMTADALSSAGVAAVHGDDPKKAAMLGAAIPVVGAVAGGAASALRRGGIRLARAAIKPTVAEMRQTAGASRIGIDNVADRLASFIIKKRLTTPEKAQAIINEAEAEIQGLVGNQATDAPARAVRYLKALERSAAKQGLGADDVASLRNAAGELINGPMGEDVITTATSMRPSTVLGPNGQPAAMVPVATSTTSRALRGSVPADEALESARASSRWSTRRGWGEQKGASMEASKAVERAQRDAVKTAVPDSKPVFGRYSQAIKARDVLSRKAFREGNRDVVGLPAYVVAAGEIARGKVPILSFATNLLRNNQLPAGIWADRLAGAIRNNDVQAASAILARLGVSQGAHADANDPMEQELLSRVR